ncbi:hypothetical protein GOBAR_DD12288 [Gossypium barbadense]|nr:hypothetical protein GOBAR_DD12288 [Gossypium barbadense]
MEVLEKMISEDEDVLLPGFRFYPTEEELVGFYLRRKRKKIQEQHKAKQGNRVGILESYWDRQAYIFGRWISRLHRSEEILGLLQEECKERH